MAAFHAFAVGIVAIGRRAVEMPALVQGGRHLVTEAGIVRAAQKPVKLHVRRSLIAAALASTRPACSRCSLSTIRPFTEIVPLHEFSGLEKALTIVSDRKSTRLN